MEKTKNRWEYERVLVSSKNEDLGYHRQVHHFTFGPQKEKETTLCNNSLMAMISNWY